LYDDLITMM